MKKYIRLTIYCILYSAGFQLFIEPCHLAPGGFSGVAVIANALMPFLPTGTFLFLLNIPILLIGWLVFKTRFIISTFYCTALNSLFMNILALYGKPVTKDPMLAAIMGGVITAFALGQIFKLEATTGGMDIVVKLIKRKHPYVKTSRIFLLADIMVVFLAALLLKHWELALYSAICTYTVSKVMDKVLYGTDEARFVYIISKKHRAVTMSIVYKLGISATLLNGRGAYREQELMIVMCVVKKRMYPKLERMVHRCDPEAFMIVSSAMEVFGEGYKTMENHI